MKHGDLDRNNRKSYFEVEAEVKHCLTVVNEGVHLAYKIKFNI